VGGMTIENESVAESAGAATSDEQLIATLVDRARSEGLQLTGEGGLLQQLTKRVLESALEGEITDHLGYGKHDAVGRNSGNSRNGTRAKTVLTDVGPVEVKVPRDVAGTFEPQIVRKRQRRLTGVDEMVLSLSAKGADARLPRRRLRDPDQCQDHRGGRRHPRRRRSGLRRPHPQRHPLRAGPRPRPAHGRQRQDSEPGRPGLHPARASRTQIRSVSWLIPMSLATDAYVPPGLAWYSATASAWNSGLYFDVPNGNSCSMDPHDPMIRVSTTWGKRPLEEEPEVLHPCARPERADEIAPLLALASADSPNAVWELGRDSARRYRDEHGDLDVRSRYCGPDRFYLGWWLGKQRTLRESGLLLPDRIEALDELGMIWEHPTHSIEYRLRVARGYADRHGHLVPRDDETHGGIHLGRWMAERRREARHRTVPLCYERALNEIYPWWRAARWGTAWHHTYAAARLAACRGKLPFPDRQPDSDDPPLTRWLDGQIGRPFRLDPDQHDLLGALQLDHPLALLLRRPRSSAGWFFLRGLHAAFAFWRSNQHLDVPPGHLGLPLGPRRGPIQLARWLDGCRRGPEHLTEDQRKALEALDMRWI
jgi:Transposase, Mutator family/Helicase associated domain